MFRQQIRAILRATPYGKVRLLVPMVAHMSEARHTLEAVARAKVQLLEAGKPFVDNIEIGAMVEVPAAALILPRLLTLFDFVSIGTNDLIQYTLAIDRADDAVAHLYDPWHPAVLKLVAQSIHEARKADKHVSVCGEMAGDPAFTELLLAMGLRSFSMHPAQIAAVKQQVIRTDVKRWTQHLEALLNDEHPQVRCADIRKSMEIPATPTPGLAARIR